MTDDSLHSRASRRSWPRIVCIFWLLLFAFVSLAISLRSFRDILKGGDLHKMEVVPLCFLIWFLFLGIYLPFLAVKGFRSKTKVSPLTALAPIFFILLFVFLPSPGTFRARERSRATRILEDLRMIDAAIDQYAIEFGKEPGEVVSWNDVQRYLKPDTTLYSSGATDLLGNRFVITSVGEAPKVADKTFNALSDVAPQSFWSPFRK